VGNIYVPLDYSDVMKFVPEGEETIYSTKCKVEVWDHHYYSASSNKWKTYKYNVHVIMTKKGLAFHVPPQIIYDKSILKTREVPDGIFLGWHFVNGFGVAKTIARLHFGRIDIEKIGWKAKKSGSVSFGFKLIRDVNYESKETYKLRVKEFKSVMGPIWSQANTEHVKKIYELFDNNPNFTYEDYNNKIGFYCGKIHFAQLKSHWKDGYSVQEYLNRQIGKY
jgi:hypothetical protein